MKPRGPIIDMEQGPDGSFVVSKESPKKKTSVKKKARVVKKKEKKPPVVEQEYVSPLDEIIEGLYEGADMVTTVGQLVKRVFG